MYKIKLLQGSAVTQTTLGGLTIHHSVANFLIVYMCQKLWKLAGSRRSYCKNYLAYFFGPPCISQSQKNKCSVYRGTCSSSFFTGQNKYTSQSYI